MVYKDGRLDGDELLDGYPREILDEDEEEDESEEEKNFGVEEEEYE